MPAAFDHNGAIPSDTTCFPPKSGYNAVMPRSKSSKGARPRTSPRSPSIREIATKLGVSKSSVGLALNTPAENCPLSTKTRERIIRAAQEMGYRTNSLARSMRTGRFKAVSVTVGSHHPFFLPAELIYGAESYLEKHGIHIIVSWLDEEKLASGTYVPKVLDEWACDGALIYCQHTFPESIQRQIDRFLIPAIWLNTKLDYDCVYVDDFQAARTATAHLIKLGHRRIAYACLEGPTPGHYSEQDRLGGYRTAMSEAGLTPHILPPPTSVPLRDIREDQRHVFAKNILSHRRRPTAILCYEISIAAPLLVGAISLGMSVPRDLSLMAFGRMNFNDTGHSISTIRLRLDEVGRRAAELILRKIEHPEIKTDPVAVPITWDHDLTLAPPPRRGAA